MRNLQTYGQKVLTESKIYLQINYSTLGREIHLDLKAGSFRCCFFHQVQYDDGYLHVFVYEPLPHTGMDPELKSYETGKTLEDVLLPPLPSPRLVQFQKTEKDCESLSLS